MSTSLLVFASATSNRKSSPRSGVPFFQACHNDSTIFAWLWPDPGAASDVYGCGGGQNYGGYCSSTVTSLLQAADGEEITSRFIFWGYMNFKLIESFDLFSFGDRANQKNTRNGQTIALFLESQMP